MAESCERKKVKKRSYDAAFKLTVVEYAQQNTNRGAGKKYGVDEKNVREWKKQKSKLENSPSTKRRLAGGGRKPQQKGTKKNCDNSTSQQSLVKALMIPNKDSDSLKPAVSSEGSTSTTLVQSPLATNKTTSDFELTANVQPSEMGDAALAQQLSELRKSVTSQFTSIGTRLMTIEARIDATDRAEVDPVTDRPFDRMSVSDIQNMLDELNLQQYKAAFKRESVSGDVLVELDEETLAKELGVQSKIHRVRIMKALRQCKDTTFL